MELARGGVSTGRVVIARESGVSTWIVEQARGGGGWHGKRGGSTGCCRRGCWGIDWSIFSVVPAEVLSPFSLSVSSSNVKPFVMRR